MGFFSDLKQDLSQAVNELMPNEEMEETLPIEETPNTDVAFSGNVPTSDELSDMLERMEDLDALSLNEEPALAYPFLNGAGRGLNLSPAAAESVMAKPEPAAVAPEPVIAKPEPAAVIPEPVIAKPESVAVAPESVITKPEPVAVAPEPVIARPEPVAVAPEPVIARPEPVAAAPEPVITEPAVAVSESIIAKPEPVPTLAETQSAAVHALVEENNIEPESMGMNKSIDENRREERKMEVQTKVATDETAVVTEGMSITGDIISGGSLELIGSVTGNIEVLGKLNITGTIHGNSKAAEIFAEGARINGEINTQGSVKIGQSSVVIGNISATSAVIAGAVKGDIDIHGPVVLDTSAIVMGNIKSKSVQINNGAVIEGLCSQCYADVNPTSFFEEIKKKK